MERGLRANRVWTGKEGMYDILDWDKFYLEYEWKGGKVVGISLKERKEGEERNFVPIEIEVDRG